ncbi:SKA3 protein, partial [Catharus fuscescens]|nr:SKA3 protein [Catharus fuscescens]
MDVTRSFFGKLRELALTVEKEVKQMERAMRREDVDYEDESPIAVLHDLRCKIKAHKEEVSASLDKSYSEEKAIREFMKASEILMQRNAADLGKISELFQKYGYKTHVKDSTAMSVQNKSDEEKANDVPHLSASTEKPLLPKDPLRSPQLSDFGLSQLAVSRPWSVVKAQQTASARQQNSKNETPLRLQTPRALPKTPKCKLKMDDYECELEHFGISEHTMCMNEDYTMSLIHKTSQTIKNSDCFSAEFSVFPSCCTNFLLLLPLSSGKLLISAWYHLLSAYGIFSLEYLGYAKIILKIFVSSVMDSILNSFLVKRGDTNLPEMTIKEIMVTPTSKSSKGAENAHWTASPMVFVFCTPDVKASSRTTNAVLSRSPETKELPLPSTAATPQCPDFQTRWLKAEAKVVNSNYVHFHTLCHKQILKWGKIESVTKNDAKDTPYKEKRIAFAASCDEYLKHPRDPSPPKLEDYDHLLNTPPPPEITRIPDDVLKMLSQYNRKVDASSKAKEMENKAGNTRRYESYSTDYCNKENR